MASLTEAYHMWEFGNPSLKKWELYWDLVHRRTEKNYLGKLEEKRVSHKVIIRVRWTYKCPIQTPCKKDLILQPSAVLTSSSGIASVAGRMWPLPRVMFFLYVQANFDGPFLFHSCLHSWLKLSGLHHSLIFAFFAILLPPPPLHGCWFKDTP